MKTVTIKIWMVIFLTIVLYNCIEDRNFDRPESSCDPALTANTSYAQVKGLYAGETVQIQQDLIIEGYVISSDKAGNFFGELYFQDSPVDPTEGFQMSIDLRDSYLFYPVGSKIFIKLKGLYLGKNRDVFKIGGAFTSFGNTTVGRLPATVAARHIFTSCGARVDIIPTLVSIDILRKDLTQTLVRFERVEILFEELARPFAMEGEETERTLIDCDDNEIMMLNSGFSDFQAELLPNGSGTITAVLLRENDDYRLAIRDLNDIDLSQERCADVVDEFTSNHIFITELADPDNNTGARFVELYNDLPEPLSLKGWILRRYTNANTEWGATIDLTGVTIPAKSTLVISPNAAEFEKVYGFVPDLGVGTNSPADSNGDDNLELVDPFGTIIDAFGVVGEDGSGTNHEFEDGRAVRNAGITEGNPNYTFEEWTIYNDSGASGTINQPKNAPDDFTPGVRD